MPILTGAFRTSPFPVTVKVKTQTLGYGKAKCKGLKPFFSLHLQIQSQNTAMTFVKNEFVREGALLVRR